MDIGKLKKFREKFVENNKIVSKIEYAKNNYDNNGNLINEDLPIITTDFCEVGLYGDEFYFVFVIESKTFNSELFDQIKNKSNVKIYGFIDFNKTLFPIKNFKFDNLMEEIQKDKYLQIQFDFKNSEIDYLYKEYCDLVNCFIKNKIVVVNQLENDLIKKNI